ncbi:MAG: hypothetical protein FWC11_01155 [Firmicutes bacterium]|nr:hypothetical protein [Bacillota bacterium]
MILSGLLMYGAAQKKKLVSFSFLAILFVYLIVASQNWAFFAVNISLIFALSLVLRKINCHLLKSASILVYSILIDIISFYLFTMFPINVSLGTYVWAGILFNLRSAIPAIALGLSVNVVVVVDWFLSRKRMAVNENCGGLVSLMSR